MQDPPTRINTIMSQTYFVTGIGTDVGKTVAAAVLVEKLQADYWKPIQCGDLAHSDTDKVRALVSAKKSVFHSESYRLQHPFSPHKTADLEGIKIEPDRFILPVTTNHLIIEGAGGLMVPMTHEFLIIDLIERLKTPVILIVRHYLGSINHTLLSLSILKQRNIPIAGMIFNGKRDAYSEAVILDYSGVKCIGYIEETQEINKEFIAVQSKLLEL